MRTFLFSLFCGFFIYGCSYSDIAPQCKVSDFTVTDDVKLTSLDYGFKIDAQILNTGTSGTMRVEGILRTSEGDFTETKSFNLQSGELRTITFNFSEPTISAKDVSGIVRCK